MEEQSSGKHAKRVRRAARGESGMLVWCVEFAAACVGYVGYFAGPVCVVVALALIGGLGYMHLTLVVPYHCAGSLCYYGHLLFTLWWVFNIAFNYYHGITTSPGTSLDVRLPEPPDLEHCLGRSFATLTHHVTPSSPLQPLHLLWGYRQ